MRIARPALVGALAAALGMLAVAPAPSRAAAPIAADEVMVMTAGALSMASRPGYMLRYRRNGTAAYDGPLNGRDGHYEAIVDFGPVQAAITTAHLCERSGIPLFVEGPPVHRSHRPPGQDSVLLRLRCADDVQHNDVKTFNEQYTPDLPAVAETLLNLSKNLDWHYAGPAQRQSGVRFAR